jgi:hypothetical protein
MWLPPTLSLLRKYTIRERAAWLFVWQEVGKMMISQYVEKPVNSAAGRLVKRRNKDRVTCQSHIFF